MVKIRKARKRDIPDLELLFLNARRETFTWEDPGTFRLEDYLKSTEGEVVFVAEESREIVGFMSVWADDSFIHNLFIRSDRKNKGIGTLLLEKAIQSFPAPLFLKALIKNINACQFYERKGWEIVSTHINVPEPHHMYRYQKP